MKKAMSLVLVIVMVLSLLPSAAAEEGALVLPANTRVIKSGAFAGDTSILSVVVPKKVESIESGAFSGCTELKDIYFGKSDDLTIAADAFTDCDDLHFYVYPDTEAESFALIHGFECDLLETDVPAYNKVLSLVKNNGGASILRSNFQSKRLIVVRDNNKLPDISAFNPVDIVRDEDTFFVQFSKVEDTVSCYTMLLSDKHTVLAEEDKCVNLIDGVISASDAEKEISAAGMLDEVAWNTDDPMGFDAYSPYVATNANGRVTIAVLDSGISRLPSYSSMLREDGCNMRVAEDGEGWDVDYNMHGSVIASVIKDCVGNSPVSLMSVRVVGAEGNASNSIIGLGIKYIINKHKIDPNISIINMSLNFQESAYVKKLINDAVNAGITVVVAAGNEKVALDRVFPANMDNVVTVAGLAPNYKLSNSTNYGPQVDYTAPDCYIKTSAYSWFQASGTSFSTPMIASALALVKLDPYHDITKMNATCSVSEDTGNHAGSYGHGLPHLDKIAKVPVSNFDVAVGTRDVLTVGEDMQLDFFIQPDNATDKAVRVVSDNTDVIETELDTNGNVILHAKAKGNAKLIASTDGGDISKEFTFNVVQNVTSIEVVGAPEILPLTRTAQLTAIVKPDDADVKDVEWASTNTEVATVDENGLVTPVNEGTCAVYARAVDGYGTQSTSAAINVVNLPDPESIVLTDGETNITGQSLLVTPGSTFKISTAVMPEDADQGVSFNSSSACVTVDGSGLVTAIEPGTATITAVSTYKDSITSSVSVQVAVMPSGLTISGNTTLDEETTSTLAAVFNPPDTTDQRVTWSSSNTAIATVDGNGTVRGVSSGNAVITVTSVADGGKTANVTVTVKHPYTLNLDPTGGNINGITSKSAYSGYAIGELPNASRDYYDFLGWYTGQNGTGEKISGASTPTVSGSSLTLYAHWQQHPEYGWSTSIPTGADATAVSYSYTLSYSANNPYAESGYSSNGYSLQWANAGTEYFGSFQGGFDTGNYYYQKYAVGYTDPYENDYEKCDVSRWVDHWVYWHWGYDSGGYSNSANRPVASSKGTYKTSWGSAYFKYFTAIESWEDRERTYDEGSYCCGNNEYYLYNGQGLSSTYETSTWRYIRSDIYRNDWTKYTKMYQYYKNVSYDTTDPNAQNFGGKSVTNRAVYYKYRYR